MTVNGGLTRTYGVSGGKGTTLTASTTDEGAYGNFVELTAATDFDTNSLLVSLTELHSADFYVDLAVGPVGSETVIVPKMLVRGRGSNSSGGSSFGPYSFPLVAIPGGSRLSARCASTVYGAELDVAVTVSSGPFAADNTDVVVYGAPAEGFYQRGTNIDPGATPDTESGWVELTGATTRDHEWLALGIRCGDITLAAGTRWAVDLAVGTTGNEQAIISDLIFSAETTGDLSFTGVADVWCHVPAGSRLSARVQSSVGTDTDRDVYVSAYGC